MLDLAKHTSATTTGILYLENNLAPGTFTPQRTAVLELLASQAAISLEHARLYAELIDENSERRKVEEALRASQASLAQGQQISHTGSWRWNIRSGEFRGSVELFRILDLDSAIEQLSYSKFIERVHLEDRPRLIQAFDSALQLRSAFGSLSSGGSHVASSLGWTVEATVQRPKAG